MTDVATRLTAVHRRLREAAERAGRDPSTVRLVAVSKRHPVGAIEAAFAAGQVDFGENFAQELAAKHRDATCGDQVTWHFIGHLQRNKVKLVVGVAALIHAVDSERLVDEIDKRAAAAGTVQRVLVEVNVAGEASKAGVAPGELEPLLRYIDGRDSIRCHGLMTMPPWPDDPEDSRPHYRSLRELRDQMARPDRPLNELSMGTTGDVEVAVEEGATLVRVGTAVFGPRP